MNGKIIAGIVVLVLGIVLIGILCGLGGYARGAVDEGVKTRLEYELPEGYKKDPNFEQCYKSTVAMFDEEYYLWNLTNLDVVLAGGRAQFNLTGPFSYTEEYCEYDHSINEETGLLQYKEYSNGYHYLPGSSVSSTDDDVFITNVNPGYLAVIGALGGDDSSLPGAFVGGALEKIITDLQSAVPLVWLQALPAELARLNDRTTRVIVFDTLALDIAGDQAAFFTPGYITTRNRLDGFTTFTNVSLSNTTILWEIYTVPVHHVMFSDMNASTIMQTYGLNETEANAAIAYDTYLLNALKDLAPEQWANGGNVSNNGNRWEIGYPNRTDISTTDVLRLWDPLFVCSLVNSSTFQTTWLAALQTQDLSYVTCPGLTITVAQKMRVLQYLQTFSSTQVRQMLEGALQFSDWNNFGYAQWGQFLLKRSLAPNPAQFIPEINSDMSSSSKYEIAQAKSLLNGTHGLFKLENVQLFNKLASQYSSGNETALEILFATWDAIESNGGRLLSLISYLQSRLIPRAIVPQVNQLKAAGGGMFTTRSVREWLFTARDPLLAVIRPDSANVGLVGNSTISKGAANYTYVRVYTGKNDLYWSLMPSNDGEQLDFWCGPVSVTGYNGSQFLPNGYVDKPKQFEKYPLNLYHKKITRPIPFQNKGKLKWDGIDTRYLTMADDALASENINNLNAAYCQKYSGVVNKTSNPPRLPLFLTTPNFNSADEIFYKDINFTDLIYAPTYDKNEKYSLHRLALFVLVEPKLGSSVWGNLPIQANFKYGSTTAYPNVVSAYAPIYWNAIGDKATPDDLHTIETDLYANQRAWKILIGVGVGVGVSLVIAGIVMIAHFKKHEFELKDG